MSDYIEIPEEYWPEPEELPADLRRVAIGVERVWPGNGVKVALILGQLFAGVPIYPANMGKILRKIRDDAIRKEYDAGGVVAKDLALKYNLSQRSVEKILAQAGSEVKSNRNQLQLF